MLCLTMFLTLDVDGWLFGCGWGVDEGGLHRCNLRKLCRGGLWIELFEFSTEWVEAVGKRTKNSKNFVPMSACRT